MQTKIVLLALAFVVVVPTTFAYRAYAESAPTTIEQFKQTCFDSVLKVVVVFVIFLGIEQGVRMAVCQGTGAFFFLFYLIVCLFVPNMVDRGQTSFATERPRSGEIVIFAGARGSNRPGNRDGASTVSAARTGVRR